MANQAKIPITAQNSTGVEAVVFSVGWTISPCQVESIRAGYAGEDVTERFHAHVQKKVNSRRTRCRWSMWRPFQKRSAAVVLNNSLLNARPTIDGVSFPSLVKGAAPSLSLRTNRSTFASAHTSYCSDRAMKSPAVQLSWCRIQSNNDSQALETCCAMT